MSEMKSMAKESFEDGGRAFGFSRSKKILFFATYVWTKTVSFWYEVKAPRLRLFMYEVIYSVCRAVHAPPPRLGWLRLNRVSTVFGVFNIRPGTTDAACVSPGFERPDLNHLIVLLRKQLSAGRSVLFVDVGADVGTYSISVANLLGHLKGLSVVAFEPSCSSYDLLCENVAVNGLAEIVDPRPLGLGDGSIESGTLQFNPREPGSRSLNPSLAWRSELAEEVVISTIDKQIGTTGLANVVALKLDVEGSEMAVLNGASATLAAADEVLLMVEDFVDETVVSYLRANGWSFQEKLTPYNSFWRYSRDHQS
jgi:FkbM family methyltransferase